MSMDFAGWIPSRTRHNPSLRRRIQTDAMDITSRSTAQVLAISALGQGWMHQKHHTGFTERPGDSQSLFWSKSGIVEGLFEIDLRAATPIAGDAPVSDFTDDPVPGPTFSQLFRSDEEVTLVPRMLQMIRDQLERAATCISDAASRSLIRIATSGVVPITHASQLNTADCCLHFRHSEVRAKCRMQPAKTRAHAPGCAQQNTIFHAPCTTTYATTSR